MNNGHRRLGNTCCRGYRTPSEYATRAYTPASAVGSAYRTPQCGAHRAICETPEDSQVQGMVCERAHRQNAGHCRSMLCTQKLMQGAWKRWPSHATVCGTSPKPSDCKGASDSAHRSLSFRGASQYRSTSPGTSSFASVAAAARRKASFTACADVFAAIGLPAVADATKKEACQSLEEMMRRPSFLISASAAMVSVTRGERIADERSAELAELGNEASASATEPMRATIPLASLSSTSSWRFWRAAGISSSSSQAARARRCRAAAASRFVAASECRLSGQLRTKGAASATPSAAVARCVSAAIVANGDATGRDHDSTTESGCNFERNAGRIVFLMWIASSNSSLAFATSYAFCWTAISATASRCCLHASASSYLSALSSSLKTPSNTPAAGTSPGTGEADGTGESKAPGGLRTSMELKLSSSLATRLAKPVATGGEGPSKSPKSSKSSSPEAGTAAGGEPTPLGFTAAPVNPPLKSPTLSAALGCEEKSPNAVSAPVRDSVVLLTPPNPQKLSSATAAYWPASTRPRSLPPAAESVQAAPPKRSVDRAPDGAAGASPGIPLSNKSPPAADGACGAAQETPSPKPPKPSLSARLRLRPPMPPKSPKSASEECPTVGAASPTPPPADPLPAKLPKPPDAAAAMLAEPPNGAKSSLHDEARTLGPPKMPRSAAPAGGPPSGPAKPPTPSFTVVEAAPAGASNPPKSSAASGAALRSPAADWEPNAAVLSTQAACASPICNPGPQKPPKSSASMAPAPIGPPPEPPKPANSSLGAELASGFGPPNPPKSSLSVAAAATGALDTSDSPPKALTSRGPTL
mmetsp:Transcript_10978/g.33865  ORF Transcript_10978/g.33865 Transcript_10978/m.33865 type:complete len:814 (-) Transcript_10978:2410-4851(-)|eukprot:scaffold151172_cov19-Tisochrysis_lutea.AAC.2